MDCASVCMILWNSETAAIYFLLWSIVTSIQMPRIPYSSYVCEMNLANQGEAAYEFPAECD